MITVECAECARKLGRHRSHGLRAASPATDVSLLLLNVCSMPHEGVVTADERCGTVFVGVFGSDGLELANA